MAAYLAASRQRVPEQCIDENVVQEIVVTRRDAGVIVDLISRMGGEGARRVWEWGFERSVEEVLDRLGEVDGVV
jgi:hypothetical protein